MANYQDYMVENPGYDTGEDPFEYFSKPWKRRLPFGLPGEFPQMGLDMGNQVPFGGALGGGISSYPAQGAGGDSNTVMQLLPTVLRVLAQQTMGNQGSSQTPSTAVFPMNEGMAPPPSSNFMAAPYQPTQPPYEPAAMTSGYVPGESLGAGYEMIGFPGEYGTYGSPTTTPTSNPLSGLPLGMVGSSLADMFGGNPAMKFMAGNLGNALTQIGSPLASVGAANIPWSEAGSMIQAAAPTVGGTLGAVSNLGSYFPINTMLGEAGYDRIPGWGGYAQSIIGAIPLIGPIISGMLGGIWGSDHPPMEDYAARANLGNIQSMGPQRVEQMRSAGLTEEQIAQWAIDNGMEYIGGWGQRNAAGMGGPSASNVVTNPSGLIPMDLTDKAVIQGLYTPGEREFLDQWMTAMAGQGQGPQSYGNYGGLGTDWSPSWSAIQGLGFGETGPAQYSPLSSMGIDTGPYMMAG